MDNRIINRAFDFFVQAINYETMRSHRPWVAPTPPAWSNRRSHENNCKCERCAHLQVNGHAPQE